MNINKIRNYLKKRKYIGKRLLPIINKLIFSCDIPYETQIHESVLFLHNGLGCVINKKAIIDEGVIIQHHVCIGSTDTGSPHIHKNVFIRCGAIIIGGIEIKEGARIGAGAIVTHNVRPYATVVGNYAHEINTKE